MRFTARRIPFAWIAPFITALAMLLTAGGCEVVVPDSVPSFTCAGLGNTCPGGKVCVSATGQCIETKHACTVAGCADGMRCDAPTQVCVPVAGDGGAPQDSSNGGTDTGGSNDATTIVDSPAGDTIGPCRGIGCACAGPSACDSNVCGDQLTLTPELYAATHGNVCTKACCTSSDCDAGSVCFAAGDGGNYCVRPDALGRTAPGSKKGGDSCASGTDCRSGVCGNAGFCEDTCCSAASASCGTGTACRLQKFAGKTAFDTHYTFACGTTNASGNAGDTCSSDSSCKSNLCFATTQFGTQRCREACHGSGSCANGSACTQVLLSSLGFTTNDLAVACYSGAGSAALGATCAQSGDCKSLACDKTLNRCTDACLLDADCSAVSGWHCRPQIVQVQGGGSYSVLECGP